MANEQQPDMDDQQYGDLNAAGTPEQQQTQHATPQGGQDSESGRPGGGVGRREGPFDTGVYPVSADAGAAADAPLEGENTWGQGPRGAAGYQDSGGAGLDDAGAQAAEQEGRQEQEPSTGR